MEKYLRPIIYFLLAAALIAVIIFPAWLFPREKLFSEDNPFKSLQETEIVSESVEVTL